MLTCLEGPLQSTTLCRQCLEFSGHAPFGMRRFPSFLFRGSTVEVVSSLRLGSVSPTCPTVQLVRLSDHAKLECSVTLLSKNLFKEFTRAARVIPRCVFGLRICGRVGRFPSCAPSFGTEAIRKSHDQGCVNHLSYILRLLPVQTASHKLSSVRLQWAVFPRRREYNSTNGAPNFWMGG